MGSFQALPTPSQLQTQQEEADSTLHRDTILLVRREEEMLSSAPGNSSASEKPPHFELPGSSEGLAVHNSPPNFPLLSFKSLPLLCPPDLPRLVCLQFFRSQINAPVAGKVTGRVYSPGLHYLVIRGAIQRGPPMPPGLVSKQVPYPRSCWGSLLYRRPWGFKVKFFPGF